MDDSAHVALLAGHGDEAHSSTSKQLPRLDVALALVFLPRGQVVHWVRLVRPEYWLYLPTEQDLHLNRQMLSWSLYFPLGHLRHMPLSHVAQRSSRYEPMEQAFTQLEELSTLYMTGPQPLHWLE